MGGCRLAVTLSHRTGKGKPENTFSMNMIHLHQNYLIKISCYVFVPTWITFLMLDQIEIRKMGWSVQFNSKTRGQLKAHEVVVKTVSTLRTQVSNLCCQVLPLSSVFHSSGHRIHRVRSLSSFSVSKLCCQQS